MDKTSLAAERASRRFRAVKKQHEKWCSNTNNMVAGHRATDKPISQ